MRLEQPSLHFKNFVPDDDLVKYTRVIAGDLNDCSPSDARLDLLIEKTKSHYHAVAKLRSQHSQFKAELLSDDPFQLVDLIEQKMRRQIQRWRKSRFMTEPMVGGGAA